MISSGDDGGGDGGQGGAGTTIGGTDGEGYSRAINGGGGGGSAGRIRINASNTYNADGTLSPRSTSGACTLGLPPFQINAPVAAPTNSEMALTGCDTGGAGGVWLLLLALLGLAIRRRVRFPG